MEKNFYTLTVFFFQETKVFTNNEDIKIVGRFSDKSPRASESFRLNFVIQLHLLRRYTQVIST